MTNTDNSYKRIEEYGVIGNLETCALVAPDSSVDWCCFPSLESPSCFAALLDPVKGGYFAVRPIDNYSSDLSYIPETNVLQNRFVLPDGQVTLTDFMPLKGDDGVECRSIFRRLNCISGQVEIGVAFSPAFCYSKEATRFDTERGRIVARAGDELLCLQGPCRFSIQQDRVFGSLTVREGEVCWVVLQYGGTADVSDEECEKLLRKTMRFWTGWSGAGSEERFDFEKPWRDLAVRSSLALKLLTRPSTGAIAAAATTSLPEIVSGVRNWDYRYAWIRDAAFTVQALNDLGHRQEASDYFRWIRGLCEQGKAISKVRVCYTLDGNTVPEEQDLDLAGYRDSRPVRVGNRAAHQFQLDIFGELINAVYETHLHGTPLPPESWSLIGSIVDFVCDHWAEPDSGIWEMRRPPAHYTHSKLMAWVAIDRGLRLAQSYGVTLRDRRWSDTATAIKESILSRGFNSRLNSFVQTLDGEDLDATSLLIPILGLIDGRDPKVQGTLEATKKYLMEKGLIHRYLVDDGLPGKDAPFVICSFWLVTASILAGRQEEAEEHFSKIVSFAGPVGLFGEEIDVSSGEHRGNYPQGFSHIGLINSSFYLTRARRGEAVGPRSTGSASGRG